MKKKYIKLAVCLCIITSLGVNAQVPVANAQPPVATPVPIPNAYTNIKLNYLRTLQPAKPMTSSVAVSGSSSIKDVIVNTDYYDGLGRVLQSVSRGLSPAGNKDLVTPITFDAYGREQYKYLPYVSPVGTGAFRTDPFHEQSSFYQSQFTNEDIFYSESRFENSTLNKVTKQLEPGNSWGGSNRGSIYTQAFNTVSDSVRIWNVYDWIDSYSAYPPGELSKHIITNENGYQTIEYISKEGKTILKKTQASSTPGAAHVGWLCTYFAYDNLGNLRLVMPPSAVDVLMRNGWNISDENFRNELCFSYEYDHRNRMIVKKIPGSGAVEIVYDARDNQVMMMDGNRRPVAGQPGKWVTTLYDDLNRPVMTGLYTTTLSRADLQLIFNAPSSAQTIQHTLAAASSLVINEHDNRSVYKARESIEFIDGFDSGNTEMETELNSNATITQTVTVHNYMPSINPLDLEPLTYTYYDDYNFQDKKNARADFFSKLTVNPADNPDPIMVSKLIMRLETGKRVRVLGTNNWLVTTLYYDEKGRVIQQLTDNINGGEDIVTKRYNFSGTLLASYRHHTNPKSTQTPESGILTTFSFDDGGRNVAITKQLNNDLPRVIATKTYAPFGQLAKKEFKDAAGNTIESQEFDYNIRNWVTGINRKHVNNEEEHYFGEEISYDYGFTSAQYNGTVAGIRWKGSASPEVKSYGFQYDPANRLIYANYNQQNIGSSVWTKDLKDFSVSNLRYDPSGNILSMNQKGIKNNAIVDLDKLSYQYYNNSNKLKEVAEENPSSNYGLDDFRDRNTGTDYTYDNNGNLLQDMNKGITEIKYNFLNQPIKVVFGSKGYIEFVYDALGTKKRKTVTDLTGGTPKITVNDYIEEFVYINDKLKNITHEEGRIRAIYQTGQAVTFAYDYFVKDHLGNIRSIVTDQDNQNFQYLASMEQINADKENMLFNNIDATRIGKPVGYPQNDSSNDFVAKLNGQDPNKKIGPSLILKVMAGDTIAIGAQAFYKSTGMPERKVLLPVEDIASSLVRVLGASGTTVPGSHGSNTNMHAPFITQVNNDYNRLKEKETNTNNSPKRLKAYLNYVLFDNNMKLVEDNSGVKQVQELENQVQVLSKDKMVVDCSGYLYVFASNESPQDVYFDNLTVQHIPGRLLEENHYYPFGLQIYDISDKALGDLENKLLFNGKELNNREFLDNYGLDWYSYGMREYDPQIGRFFRTDPMANDFKHLTPYQYAGNDPIRNIDLDGLEPESAIESWSPTHSYTYTATNQTIEYIEGYWVSEQHGMYNSVFQYWNQAEGQWKEFTPNTKAEEYKKHAEALYSTANALGTGYTMLLVGGAMMVTGGGGGLFNITLPEIVISGGSGAASDATLQVLASDEPTMEGKIKSINITSVLSSVIIKNPIVGSSISSGFEYSVQDGWGNSLMGKKSGEQFFFESATGGALGLAAGKAANHLGIGKFSYGELRFMSNGVMNKIKVYSLHAGGSGITNAEMGILNYLLNELNRKAAQEKEETENENQN